jgi:hypothetical protein
MERTGIEPVTSGLQIQSAKVGAGHSESPRLRQAIHAWFACLRGLSGVSLI